MDKLRRDHLRSVVAKARKIIQGSLEQQLARFGLSIDDAPLPWADLGLGDDQRPRYDTILDGIRREARAVGSSGVTPDAVRRFVREAGGTWVNRLSALRALESRGLLAPGAAYVSDEYGGLSLRASRLRDQAAMEGRAFSKEEALRAGLADACRELAVDVRVLFDLEDESSLFWPDGVALKELLALFSDEVTVDDWSQPDVLGWVYQYYNTEANEALKKRKNKTTGFKFAPDDIPIANQFYTPHWVVRVLVDNTLGRLWLESKERAPRLLQGGSEGSSYRLDEHRVGVPHAATERPAFEAWIAEDPNPLRDRTVDRLCRFLVPLPSDAPPRPPKRARDLRVLDPACGSGHFLLYAFDVLFAIWREDEPDLDPREIPSKILAHNLFGIDIDLRAAQLAAFDLYLKARTTLAAIDPASKLSVEGLGIVVADAHLGDDPRKAELLARYRDAPEVQKVFARVLDALDHTNVLGSLLKVRGEFEALFGRADAGKAAQAQKARSAFARSGQRTLLDDAPQRELGEVFVGMVGRTWTLDELLREVESLERNLAPGQDIGSRLFYTDLARAVGVLTLLSRQYDVVLMNPPYGDMPEAATDYAKGHKKRRIPARYPLTHDNYATAFMEQGLDLAVANGFLGALVPRSFMYAATCAEMRGEILHRRSRPELVHEYGLGILDGATVRTAGAVFRRREKPQDEPSQPVSFQRLSYYPTALKPELFLRGLPSFASTGPSSDLETYVARVGSLSSIPGSPYAYWASDSLRSLFRAHAVLDITKVLLPAGLRPEKRADAKQGLATMDDSRFTRFWWETDHRDWGVDRTWVPFAKGGTHVQFYTRVDLVLRWKNNGRELTDWIESYRRNHPGQYLRNMDFQFRAGLTWRAVAWSTRRFGIIEHGHAFSNRGSMVFVNDVEPRAALAALNSTLAAALVLAQTQDREWHLSEIASLPWPNPPAWSVISTAKVQQVIDLRRSLHTGDETCRDFTSPDLRQLVPSSNQLVLSALISAWRDKRLVGEDEEASLLRQLDDEVAALYALSPADQALIRHELSRRPKGESGYSTSELADNVPTASVEDNDAEGQSDEEADADTDMVPAQSPTVEVDLVARWLSHYLKQTLESDDDGIIPIRAAHSDDALLDRLMRTMAADLGEEAARGLAAQAPAYLGVPDLATWLEEGFFPWHVKLYKNRPIFWLLSSEAFARGTTRLTFRAYLHALRVTEDTLSRVDSYYLDPVIDSVATEAARAAEIPTGLAKRDRTAAEVAKKEWAATLEALRLFRTALRSVIEGPPKMEVVPANAKWLAKTIASVRGGRDVGHGYRPDVDFGVRVNLTPLAEKKLLPRALCKQLGG